MPVPLKQKWFTTWIGVILLLWTTVCGLATAQAAALKPLAGQPAVVLVSEQVEPAPVLYPPDANRLEITAARELAKYLTAISGKPFTAEAAKQAALDQLPKRGIFVGAFPIDLPEGINDSSFVIRTNGEQLFIRGKSNIGTIYGVFGLLEDQLGCRWWARDAEFVPSNPEIAVTAQDTLVSPAFRMHDLYNKEAQNNENLFIYKRRAKSPIQFTSGHSLCPMLKPYSEEHPEFLPMDKNGNRKFNNLHMNYTAPGMSQALAEAIEARDINRNKGNVHNWIYFAGMGDWYGGMDLSPESKAVYEEETWTDPDGRKKPGYTATLLRMINKTAEILDKKYPGIMVGTFAYMSLEAPPAHTKPRENVAIWLPRLRHDTVRSVTESPKNASFRRNLDRWAELCPDRLYIWEYGTSFSNFLVPMPCLRSLAQNIKYYHKVGVTGVSIQGNYVSTGGDMTVMKNYVWGKLMWDPSLDIDDLIREFCMGYYGPAGETMLKYINLVEGSVRDETPISADEFANPKVWMTDELVKQSQDLFAKALSQTAGDDSDPYYVRVREAQVGIEAFLLWKSGPLKEQGERLVRADFPEDTYQRAQDLVKYCREASPREWGSGRAYRMGFLTMHGGPMPILKNGGITAKVAPMQNGELRAILRDDVNAIDGSELLANPGVRLYEITERKGPVVTMRGEAGIANWGSGTRQLVDRCVEVTGDGTVVETATARMTPGGIAEHKPTIQTTFDLKGKLANIRIEYQNEAGQWVQVTPSKDKEPVDIPRAAHLRITRLDRKLVIDDRYQGPEGQTPQGKLIYDPKANLLQLRVSTGTVPVNVKEFVPLYRREVRVTPSAAPES